MAIRERLVSVGDPAGWAEALAGMPHGYWHGWHACRAASLSSGASTFLWVCEDTDAGWRAACPFSERHWQGTTDIYTPAGFSGFCNTGAPAGLAARWRAFCVSRGYVCAYLALHPVLSPSVLFADLGNSNDLYVLPTTGDAESLHGRVDRSVRRALRDWETAGSAFVTDRTALGEFLRARYRPFMLALGANSAAMWSDEALALMCGDDELWMVGVEDGDGLCAVHTFAVTPWGAESHLNISVRDGRRYTTPMIDWGIRRCLDAGLPWLNLGGGVVRDDAVARAKQKFRPDRLPLLSVREIYDEARYQALCRDAGVDPASREGFFPNYRAPGRR